MLCLQWMLKKHWLDLCCSQILFEGLTGRSSRMHLFLIRDKNSLSPDTETPRLKNCGRQVEALQFNANEHCMGGLICWHLLA